MARWPARTLIVIALAAVVTGGVSVRPAQALDPPPVQVKVTKQIQAPGRVIYRYEVVNGSAFPITAVSIGNDHYGDETELSVAPLGWRGDSLPQTPASSVQSPPNWSFQILNSEGGGPATADWDAVTPGDALLGGTSLSGFAVILPREDARYEDGHWTAYLNTNEEMLYSGFLQPSGATGVPESSIFAKSDLRIKRDPATGTIGLRFAVPVAGGANVVVFDAQGRFVKRVANKQLPTGDASLTWDGRDGAGKSVAAGVYFVCVRTANTVRFGRIRVPK